MPLSALMPLLLTMSERSQSKKSIEDPPPASARLPVAQAPLGPAATDR